MRAGQSVDRLLVHRNPHEPALPWILGMAGIDLEVAQALPHSPDETELSKAEGYVQGLIDWMEREDQDRWRGEAEAGA